MKNYSPTFFLASLGAGGMSISFFIYLLFLIPHKGVPLVTFNHILSFFNKTNMLNKGLIFLALLGIIYFAYKHISLLIWNLKEYKKFKQEKLSEIKGTLKEVTLMAIPLTLAMTINVMFVLGAVFVPNLWGIIEYMFPFALLGFLAVGIYAFKIFGEYFIPIIFNGNEEWEKNNNFVQLLSVFAFSMIGVGFAAPGAMSNNIVVNAIGIFFAFMFLGAGILLGIVKLILGFHSIVKNGMPKAAMPSLWILIPILTLIGITLIRIAFGLAHHFTHESKINDTLFFLTGFIFAIQILIGIFGYIVMKKANYFKEFIDGDKKDVSSYALICPGVAFFVFGMFFIHWGLVYNHIVPKYSIVHFILIALLAIIQYKTIVVMLKLNKKFGL